MRTFPRRAVRRFNACAMALRSSPRFGKAVSKRLTVVTYTGRRSGRTFSTPVAYRRTGSTVTITVAFPNSKSWWRNFLGEGGPLSLDLDGTAQTGHAVAKRDERGRVSITVLLDEV